MHIFFLYVFMALATSVKSLKGNHSGSRHLWYDSPGSDFRSSLPIGNGRLGALVQGSISEKIIINENSVWSGPFQDRINPGSLEALPTRKLMTENDYTAAAGLASDMNGIPPQTRWYSVTGNLLLDFGHQTEEVSNYERWLDTLEGTTGISYDINGVTFTREVVTNFPLGVITARFTASKDGALNIGVSLERDRGVISNIATGGANNIMMNVGSSGADAIPFTVGLRVVSNDGTIKADGSSLNITKASTVDIFLDVETSFQWKSESDWKDGLVNKLDQAVKSGFESLKAEATSDHQSLMERVALDLGSNKGTSSQPTDKRVSAYASQPNDDPEDTGGSGLGVPANLQGIWNDMYNRPWGSKFTVNINTEMNYWLAETTDLAETLRPLWDLMYRSRDKGSEIATKMYSCPGYVSHHNLDLWGDSAPHDSGTAYSIWASSNLWLSQHMMERYRFTGDKTFLREKAWPLFKDIAAFFDCCLFEFDGKWTSGPSTSPENVFIIPKDGSKAVSKESFDISIAMANSLLHEFFSNVIEAAGILGVDLSTDKVPSKVKDYRDGLRPTEIGARGQIPEWRQDYTEAEPGHRHYSRLVDLFPAKAISPLLNKTLANAAQKTIEPRLHAGALSSCSRPTMATQEAALGKAGTRIVTVNSEDTDLRWVELANALNPAKIAADRAFRQYTSYLRDCDLSSSVSASSTSSASSSSISSSPTSSSSTSFSSISSSSESSSSSSTTPASSSSISSSSSSTSVTSSSESSTSTSSSSASSSSSSTPATSSSATSSSASSSSASSSSESSTSTSSSSASSSSSSTPATSSSESSTSTSSSSASSSSSSTPATSSSTISGSTTSSSASSSSISSSSLSLSSATFTPATSTPATSTPATSTPATSTPATSSSISPSSASLSSVSSSFTSSTTSASSSSISADSSASVSSSIPAVSSSASTSASKSDSSSAATSTSVEPTSEESTSSAPEPTSFSTIITSESPTTTSASIVSSQSVSLGSGVTYGNNAAPVDEDGKVVAVALSPGADGTAAFAVAVQASSSPSGSSTTVTFEYTVSDSSKRLRFKRAAFEGCTLTITVDGKEVYSGPVESTPATYSKASEPFTLEQNPNIKFTQTCGTDPVNLSVKDIALVTAAIPITTAIETGSATETATEASSATDTEIGSGSATGSATTAENGSATETSSATETGSATETETGSASMTETGSKTGSATKAGSATETETGSATETETGSASMTETGSKTGSATKAGSATESETGSATKTGSAISTATGSTTKTGSATETETGSKTASASATVSGSVTRSTSASSGATIVPGNPTVVGDFTLFGCARSSNGFPTFNLAGSSASMDLNVCASLCSGKAYFGVYNTDCYCGEEVSSASATRVAIDLCDTECPGDKSEFCGGKAVSSRIVRRVVPSNILLTVYLRAAAADTVTELATITATVSGTTTITTEVTKTVAGPNPTTTVVEEIYICINGKCTAQSDSTSRVVYVMIEANGAECDNQWVYISSPCSCQGGKEYVAIFCSDGSCTGKTVYKASECSDWYNYETFFVPADCGCGKKGEAAIKFTPWENNWGTPEKCNEEEVPVCTDCTYATHYATGNRTTSGSNGSSRSGSSSGSGSGSSSSGGSGSNSGSSGSSSGSPSGGSGSGSSSGGSGSGSSSSGGGSGSSSGSSGSSPGSSSGGSGSGSSSSGSSSSGASGSSSGGGSGSSSGSSGSSPGSSSGGSGSGSSSSGGSGSSSGSNTPGNSGNGSPGSAAGTAGFSKPSQQSGLPVTAGAVKQTDTSIALVACVAVVAALFQ
ncbi:unnamed protein product [Fusarium fujikuroi]|nr:unnamed protein product [Fusarium fujikuroi]